LKDHKKRLVFVFYILWVCFGPQISFPLESNTKKEDMLKHIGSNKIVLGLKIISFRKSSPYWVK
jgi:hypothetical protein